MISDSCGYQSQENLYPYKRNQEEDAIEHRSPHQHKGDNLGAERYCLVFPEIADVWTEVPVIQQPVI